MKTIKHSILFILIIGIGLSSCTDNIRIKGNGVPASDSRDVQDFTGVVSLGTFDVHITKGTTTEVLVRAEENLLPYIETYVKGGKLQIDVSGMRSLNNQLAMEVFVTTSDLNYVKLSGSGVITSDYFEGDVMDVHLSGSGMVHVAAEVDKLYGLLSGSGNLKFSGSSRQADLKISGSGNINAYDLELEECQVNISGSGDALVFVNDYLKGIISGSGNILYAGSPEVESHISGSGRIIME